MFRFKYLLAGFLILVILFLFNSCKKEDLSQQTTFDQKLLIGKWQINNTVFYKYNSDNTGTTWDVSDPDITEEDAQKFNWKLDGSKLTENHYLETTGGTFPKTYTITELTTSKFSKKDNFDKVQTFTKVN
jgi:hypothetical protein